VRGVANSATTALCYIDHLIRMGRDWISGPEIDHKERPLLNEGLSGQRWERVRADLPERLRDLIETKRAVGHRLRLSAWRQ